MNCVKERNNVFGDCDVKMKMTRYEILEIFENEFPTFCDVFYSIWSFDAIDFINFRESKANKPSHFYYTEWVA